MAKTIIFDNDFDTITFTDEWKTIVFKNDFDSITFDISQADSLLLIGTGDRLLIGTGDKLKI